MRSVLIEWLSAHNLPASSQRHPAFKAAPARTWLPNMTNRVIHAHRDDQVSHASDGLLGWVPAIVLGYATILTPLLLQRSLYPTDASAAAASSDHGSNLFNQVFWLLLICAVLYVCRNKLKQLVGLLRRPLVVIIISYMVIAFASILWSPTPTIAFRRATLQFIVLAAVVLPTLLARNTRAQVDRLVVVFFITIALNLAAVILLPAGRLGHQGIHSHKNEFGLITAYGFIFCLYGMVRLQGLGRLLATGLAMAALAELVVSRSKTSLGLAILIPLVALVILGVSRALRVNALFPLVLGLAALILSGIFIAHLADFGFADISMLLFDDTTFTGRTTIWNFVGDVIGRAPFLGQGYASFWDIGPGSIVMREAPGFVVELLQGHNGYIDVTVELGVCGLAVLLAFLSCSVLDIGRAANDTRVEFALAWLFLSCVIVGLCHNMLESSWFRGYSVAWLIFLLAGGWANAVTKAKDARYS